MCLLGKVFWGKSNSNSNDHHFISIYYVPGFVLSALICISLVNKLIPTRQAFWSVGSYPTHNIKKTEATPNPLI